MPPFRHRSALAPFPAPLVVAALVASLLACSAAPSETARPGPASSAHPAAVREIVLDPYMGRLRTLDVTVAGETRPFLFDTAGGVTLLTVEAAERGGASLDLFVAVETSAGPLWFELDSGALSPVLVAPHAAELLGLDLSPDEARPVDLPVAGLGPVRVDAQVEEDLIYDGLLNAAFLEGLVVTLDLEEIRAWARRRPAGPR